MFVGGIRALLLQSLHPLAMAGVTDHSGFEGDPWGRLQRTSYFLAVTTFGTAADADRMVAAVRSVHERVVGTAPDGRAYAASDPHLLRWVHVAEIDSFLAAHQRYGGNRSTRRDVTPTSPTRPGSPRPSASPTRRAARPSCGSSSRTSGPSSRAPPPPARPRGSCCSTRRSRCRPGCRTPGWRLPRSG